MITLFLFVLAAPAVQSAEGTSGQILGGTLSAPVRIEVFSDFECPSCRALYLDVMRRVLIEYSSQNKVCLIYHEFPLNIHQYSFPAARYAEAAARLGQDKLLKVYDTLFMDQASWAENGNLEASVSKVLTRAEMQTLKKIMKDPSIDASIQMGVQLATQNRIRSTPTWYIYSGQRLLQKVESRLTYVALKQYLDTILK